MLVREGIDKVREAVQKLNDEVQENGSTLVTKVGVLILVVSCIRSHQYRRPKNW
jgi:hypothetical protein